ncbi:hypothetical protein BGX29_002794 [Mortierella sp. GBA35]|nr:hypothetical protein BGX29_002794 [Mortierella sp. GBA35]
MVTKKDTNTAPVLDLDAKKETRANARRNANAKPEPTELVAIATAPPPDAQELSRERKGSLRQAINVIEPPRPPSLAESRAKVFHGWWLKRRNNLMQDDSIGILVQGNILEPKAMAWHTSTIKDAPEPTLVMTFTGSFYRLQGSIDAEKMEGNGFPQDVIKAFRNGFPANWKTVLGKGNEQGATSNAPAGKGSLSGKEHNAASQAFIKPFTQQERVSTRPGESTQLAKQEEQTRRSRQEHHTRRAKEQTQQVKRDAVPPRGPGGRFKRAGMSPIDRASVRHSSVSPSLRVPTTVPSVAHVPSQLEAIVIPVVDSKSRDEGSQALSPVQSVTARGTPNKAPTPSKSSTLFKTPTLARESTPVSEQKGIQEQAPILRRASMPLRASTSSGQAFSQGEGMVPRRESAPGQSRTGPEPVRSVGEDTGAFDIPLDGNLRMRSKAVMDQLMEHTRQQSNPSPKSDMSPESDVSPETNPVKEGGESGQLPQQSLQDFGGSSKTTLLPLAKSLSSISGSSRSLFGDLDDDLSMFVDLDSIDQS